MINSRGGNRIQNTSEQQDLLSNAQANELHAADIAQLENEKNEASWWQAQPADNPEGSVDPSFDPPEVKKLMQFGKLKEQYMDDTTIKVPFAKSTFVHYSKCPRNMKIDGVEYKDLVLTMELIEMPLNGSYNILKYGNGQ